MVSSYLLQYYEDFHRFDYIQLYGVLHCLHLFLRVFSEPAASRYHQFSDFDTILPCLALPPPPLRTGRLKFVGPPKILGVERWR